jgi:DNA-binding response OmpR family regulator
MQIKMLSVDDNALTTELDRAGYKKMGVHVLSASNFEEARNCLVNDKVDIVVINADYKKIDGLQIARHFKGTEEFKMIPVVITSVQASAKLKQNAMATGADLFVEQPLPRDYFIEKLKSLLDQKTRTTERITADIEVRFEFGGKSFSSGIVDLSSSGLLLSTDLNIPDGTNLDLSFELNVGGKSLKCSGQVVRRVAINGKQPGGLGVRFTKFQSDGKDRLEAWVAKTSDSTNRLVYYL